LHRQDTLYNTPRERLVTTQWFSFKTNSADSAREEVPSRTSMITVGDFLAGVGDQTMEVTPSPSFWSEAPRSPRPSSVKDWLQNLPLSDVLARQVCPSSGNDKAGFKTLKFYGNQSDSSAFVKLLSQGSFLQEVAQVMYEGARKLVPFPPEELPKPGPDARSRASASRKTLVEDMVKIVQGDVSEYLDKWTAEEALLKSGGVINAPLAEIVDDKLGIIIRRSHTNLNEDVELQQALGKVLDAKKWLHGAHAIDSPSHLYQLLKQTRESFVGKTFWVLDDYDALVQAYEESSTNSPIFAMQLQSLGRMCEVVDLHPQLDCAWCAVSLDERERAATGLEKLLRKAEALEVGAAGFYNGLISQFTESVGVNLAEFFRELRTRFEAGQVLLPISILVPQESDFDTALQKFPEAEKGACIRLLLTRFSHSEVEKDNVLRWLMEKAISSFAGGRSRFLEQLRTLGGNATVSSSMPRQVIHKDLVIGSTRYDTQKITAADCRDAGFSPMEAKALGFRGNELRSVWEPSKLESEGYSLQQIWDILDLA